MTPMPNARRAHWRIVAHCARRVASLTEVLACGAVDTHGHVGDWPGLERSLARALRALQTQELPGATTPPPHDGH